MRRFDPRIKSSQKWILWVSRADPWFREALDLGISGKLLDLAPRKGQCPPTSPVQLPTKFELVTNPKAVKALPLTAPQLLMARADELID